MTTQQIKEIRERDERDADKTVRDMDAICILQACLDRARLLDEVERLQAENEGLRLQQPVVLQGDASYSFALAAEAADYKEQVAYLVKERTAKDARIAELERERDAAVNEIRGECFHCIYREADERAEPCWTCYTGKDCWQWRGIQPDPPTPKIIAIDFDGTLCIDAYPAIGQAIQSTIDRAKQAKADGAQLILWTCREGDKLAEAVAWCKGHGLEFDAVNDNTEAAKAQWGNNPRKVGYDELWDDRAREV